MGNLLVSLVPGRRGQTTRHAAWRLLAALAGTFALVGVVAGRLVRRVEVHGPSMRPALEPGDRLLCAPVRRLQVGDVVVLAEPGSDGLRAVKRVAALGPEGVVVHGDNAAASRDSRVYGPVARTAVLGRVWWRYFPAERAGRVRRPPGTGWPGRTSPA